MEICSFFTARFCVTYVVALPVWPAFWTLPKRESLRLEESLALDLMDFFFTLPRSANLDLGMGDHSRDAVTSAGGVKEGVAPEGKSKKRVRDRI